MVQRQQTVLVVDFGAQYAQLIARRVRELNVYSEIVPHRITAAELAADPPAALILSGGPKSVHVDGAPLLDPGIYQLGIPIFGICYGAQLIALQLGGEVGRWMRGEYAGPSLKLPTDRRATLRLPATHDVWMSHFECGHQGHRRLHRHRVDGRCSVAALESASRKSWVCIFIRGRSFPAGWLFCSASSRSGRCSPTWRWARSSIPVDVVRVPGRRPRRSAAPRRVGLSGCSSIVHKAIGHHSLRVRRHGLMRRGESDPIVETFPANQGSN